METKRYAVASYHAMLWVVTLLLCAPLVRATPRVHSASSDTVEANWPRYGGGSQEQRFSPLSQINRHTVGRLGLAWSLDLPGEIALEATPLEVDGVLYFSGSMADVYAVYARTGRLLWKYDPDAGARLTHGQRIEYDVNRGVAYWHGAIYVATKDGRMVAIDAKTGRLLWQKQFLIPGDDSTSTGAPRIVDGKVVIGNSGSESGARGYVTALDARTGKVAWRFFTVPGNPSKGFEDRAMAMAAKTWSGQWWKAGGGANPWNAITYDAELNQLYIGTANTEPYDPALRAKDTQSNLFAASVMALDPDTGRYLWHYQFNPDESWDYDATTDIVLATLKIGGKERRALLDAPKNGFFYVIDRVTGKLISAQKFGKVTWAERIDLKTGKPVVRPDARYSHAPVTLYPSVVGAHSWQAMSYSPRTGLVYIPYMQAGSTFSRSKEEQSQVYHPLKAGFMRTGVYYDLHVDPHDPMDGRGALLAWDPAQQRLRWRVDHSELWNGGTLVTAGDLVFQGLGTGRLAAYDAATGKKLWSFDAGMGIIAPPITYSIGGKQYIAVLVGWGGGADEGGLLGNGWPFGAEPRRLLSFALDTNAALPSNPKCMGDAARTILDNPALEIDRALVARGESLWDHSCAICHGDTPVGAGGAPDLRMSPIAFNRAALQRFLHQGPLVRLGMPRFDDLTDEDVKSIYQFIRSSARDSKGTAAGGSPRSDPQPAWRRSSARAMLPSCRRTFAVRRGSTNGDAH